jgi:hypothetical protein
MNINRYSSAVVVIGLAGVTLTVLPYTVALAFGVVGVHLPSAFSEVSMLLLGVFGGWALIFYSLCILVAGILEIATRLITVRRAGR